MVLLSKHDGEPLPEAHEVLFRSAVVLMVSHWEAYIEDICSEALDHLIQYTTDPAKLPKEIKKQVADEIKSSKNAIDVWELADAGWRVYIRNRMAAFKQARDRSFNTPRAVNTAEFMRRTVGIEDIKTAWSFAGKDSKAISQQLNALVEVQDTRSRPAICSPTPVRSKPRAGASSGAAPATSIARACRPTRSRRSITATGASTRSAACNLSRRNTPGHLPGCHWNCDSVSSHSEG